MVRYFFMALLLLHGAIHVLGFIKAFGLAEVDQLSLSIGRTAGVLWLLCTVFFFSSVMLYLTAHTFWMEFTLLTIIISQVLIIVFWQDAKIGTLANVLVLLFLISGKSLTQFVENFDKDVQHIIVQSKPFEDQLISAEDLDHLPLPVKQHLIQVGVLGKPKTQNMQIIFKGSMRDKGQDWFEFSSRQYNTFQIPNRLFFMEAKVRGLPTVGYHRFWQGDASMVIKVLGLFKVVDLEGEEMDKTELVTYFNDLCLFAPMALIDSRIYWREIDQQSVQADFSYAGTTISAVLIFDEHGQLKNFISDDRSARTKNGLVNVQFSTPVGDYANIGGYNLPSYGEAIWHFPDGAFTYGKFYVDGIAYNVDHP